jgi:hypothetical protein
MAKNFLDKEGLDNLWGKICSIFAPNWLAYRPNTNLGKSATNLVITHNSAMPSPPALGDGANIEITLPSATEEYAGLLSSEDKKKLNDLDENLALGGTYNSALSPKTITSPEKVGGIKQGTAISELEGKSFSELFDNLLFPITITEATVALSLSNYSALQHIGAVGPTASKFTTSYNSRGTMKIGTEVQKDANGISYYRGDKNADATKSYLTNITTSTKNDYPSKLSNTPGTKIEYQYTLAYNSTYKHTDNKEYPSISNVAGTIKSNVVSISTTLPIYATTNNIGEFTPQTLKAWSSSAITSNEMTLVAQSGGTVSKNTTQAFLIPYPAGRNTTVKIEWYNPQSGKWENHISQFIKEDTTQNINGNTINYRYYYFNSTGQIGSRKFRITF